MSVVGYYVHHVGSGHRHRAGVLAAELTRRGVTVTGLSSLPRPESWCGPWVALERDDVPTPGPLDEAGAGGVLHWAPLRHEGLLRRTSAISAWLERARPDLVVCDVSQEVTALVRLHGVPVVSVVQPGRRDDSAHALGLGLSTAVVAFWPPSARAMAVLPPDVAPHLLAIGGLSRFPPVRLEGRRSSGGERRAVVMSGAGGGHQQLADLAEIARSQTPHWSWQILGPDTWVPDPFATLCAADVVITHAGQNALAEVAAARVPALVVAQARPHGEQEWTARVLATGPWPTIVVGDPERLVWPTLLAAASSLDGALWASWVDGATAERFAEIVVGLLGGRDQRVGPVMSQ